MSRLHNISFRRDGQDFPWDWSAWKASAPSATEKEEVHTATTKVSEVSVEKGKGGSRWLLPLK